jgi:hypothetical protein
MANPSDAATAARESAPSAGFDWNRLLRATLIGAAIGGLIGLARYLARKKNAG